MTDAEKLSAIQELVKDCKRMEWSSDVSDGGNYDDTYAARTWYMACNNLGAEILDILNIT